MPASRRAGSLLLPSPLYPILQSDDRDLLGFMLPCLQSAVICRVPASVHLAHVALQSSLRRRFGFVVFMYLCNERGVKLPPWSTDAFNWTAGINTMPAADAAGCGITTRCIGPAPRWTFW